MSEMEAYLHGARLQGDKRPAAEILALAGRWRAREILDYLDGKAA